MNRRSRSFWQRFKRRALVRGRNRRGRLNWRDWAGGAREVALRIRAATWRWLPYLAVAGAAAAAPLAFSSAWHFFEEGNHFALREVRVEGNARVLPGDVLSLAGLQAGQVALDVDVDTIEAEVAKHPLLRGARVSLDLPNRLTIRVEERQAAALVALGALYYADAEGVVFERVSAGEKVEGLVVFTGLPHAAFSDETKAPAAERLVREGLGVVAEIRAHPVGQALVLDELHYDATLGWRAIFGPIGPEVQLGWGRTPAKLDRLAHILADLRARGERAAFVGLDDERDEGRAVVRLGGKPETARARTEEAAQGG